MSRYSTSRSSAKALEGVGVRVHHPRRRGRDPVTMAPAGDVVPDRPPRRLLHRDALGFCAFAEGSLLVLGEPQCHGHTTMVSD